MTHTVTVERIAAGGDGVGHLDDGMVIFVPRSAPGDVVEVEITQRRARFARGRLCGVVEEGPDRVEPRCPHYDSDECGGCQLQHMAVSAQREAKRQIVGDALRRIGKLEIADPAIERSPEEWRYRNKMTLTAKGGRIGFRPYGRPAEVFELVHCLLVHDRVMRLWNVVREHRTTLPPAVESLVLRTDRVGGSHILAIGGEAKWDAEPLAAEVDDEGTSYWWKPRDGAARVVKGPKTGFPAVAFEQVNSHLAQEIREQAVRSFGDVAGKVVWDLFGGVGDTAEMLAALGAKVWSVDTDRSAVEWGRREYSRNDGAASGVTRIAERAEEAMALLPDPDLVIANPPRLGLGSPLTDWLKRWSDGRAGARLTYISCDPATLARDLARMPTLELKRCNAFDLFPQTGHVETLTTLEAA